MQESCLFALCSSFFLSFFLLFALLSSQFFFAIASCHQHSLPPTRQDKTISKRLEKEQQQTAIWNTVDTKHCSCCRSYQVCHIVHIVLWKLSSLPHCPHCFVEVIRFATLSTWAGCWWENNGRLVRWDFNPVDRAPSLLFKLPVISNMTHPISKPEMISQVFFSNKNYLNLWRKRNG